MVKEYSAGGIVIKETNILIVLVNRKDAKVWTFPKGHIEDGETPKDAALREVFEETGIRCRIIDEKEFFVNNYTFERRGNKIFKTVYWYLMEPVEESGKIPNQNEISETKWVSLDEALETLNYGSDRMMVRMLKKRLKRTDT